MVYTQECEEFKGAREIIFMATMQSQMLAERRPFTIVALAVKFNYAIEELGGELYPGDNIALASLSQRQQLLEKVFEEYDEKCNNKQYILSNLQREPSSTSFCIPLLGSCATYPL